MVLKLYSFVNSTCGQRVALTLYEKNVPFEFHVIDPRKGEHKAPGFVEKQPFGQVPYIDDDGFILYESRAISKYIATKYASQGTSLIPTDEKKKALFEQAASVESFNFDPYASAAVFEKVFAPLFGVQTNEERFKLNVDKLTAKIDVYEKILAKQKFVAGDELTLADLFHLPYGHLLAAAGCTILIDGSRPNVARWWKEISERDSWQTLVKNKVIKGTA